MDDLLRDAAERLERAGVPDARTDAELLLSELLGLGRGALFLRRGEAPRRAVAERFERWVGRRARREPLQHIIGNQEFYGLTFHVDARVLVPRSESEGLVDALLGLGLPAPARVADLGAGSGCIAITLAAKRERWRFYALDRSAEALDVARRNARLHRVEGRIDFRLGDMASPPGDWTGLMDAVVCNPPYVAEEEWRRLAPEVRDHDPKAALVPGPTGLEAYEAVAPAAHRLLRPGGGLALELGHDQAAPVSELVSGAGFRVCEIRDDLNGVPRVLLAERARAESSRGEVRS
jgi:release factor glutamine methyltransferase